MKKVAILLAGALFLIGMMAGCQRGPDPDEVYLQYFEDEVAEKLVAYYAVVKETAVLAQVEPSFLCVTTEEVEDTARELKHALEGAPEPSHPDLKRMHKYLAEATDLQLEIVGYIPEACASKSATMWAVLSPYQQEVTKLTDRATDALDDYVRSQ